MKRTLGAALAVLLMGQAPPPGARVADLGWMSGRWVGGETGRWTEEIWSGPREGVLMGFSWSGAGAGVGDYEYLRIEAGEDGVPVYRASPRGRAAIGFRLVQAEGSSATFENPAHDFPQRIRYVRDGDAMVATISAIDGSNAMRWTYRRE